MIGIPRPPSVAGAYLHRRHDRTCGWPVNTVTPCNVGGRAAQGILGGVTREFDGDVRRLYAHSARRAVRARDHGRGPKRAGEFSSDKHKEIVGARPAHAVGSTHAADDLDIVANEFLIEVPVWDPASRLDCALRSRRSRRFQFAALDDGCGRFIERRRLRNRRARTVPVGQSAVQPAPGRSLGYESRRRHRGSEHQQR